MDMILEQFKTIFDTPEKVKKLREKILALAVRGKLVQQKGNFSSDTLFRDIINSKIKYYEENGTKKAKIITNKDVELPFDIPTGWQIICIGDLMELINGKAFKPTEWSESGLPIIRIQNLNNLNAKFNYCNFEVDNKYYVKQDELLIGWSGTPGSSFGAFIWRRGNGVLNQHIFKAIPYFNLNKEFLRIFINARLDEMIEKSHGAVGLKHITKGKFESMCIPLPTIEEQERIVNKYNELMILCDELEKALEKKVHYGELSAKSVFNDVGNASTTEQLEETLRFILLNFKDLSLGDNAVKELKNCMLQLAVKGKLVSQDPNDEPAEVLLDKIREEKERLIKEKKIKKEKPLEEVSEEEKPFELPNGWSWIRLGEYCLLNPRNNVEDSLETSFIPMKLINDGFDNKHTFESKKWKEIKSGFTHFAENDIVVAKITPCFENRKSAIMKDLINGVGAGTTELYVIRCFDDTILPKFILSIFKTEKFINGGVQTYTGTAGQQRVKKDYVRNLVVGIPPLEEQKRIVEKVDSLMSLCDELEKKIEKQKDYSNRLMESILKSSFLA